jgi:hypothetical protein
VGRFFRIKNLHHKYTKTFVMQKESVNNGASKVGKDKIIKSQIPALNLRFPLLNTELAGTLSLDFLRKLFWKKEQQ